MRARATAPPSLTYRLVLVRVGRLNWANKTCKTCTLSPKYRGGSHVLVFDSYFLLSFPVIFEKIDILSTFHVQNEPKWLWVVSFLSWMMQLSFCLLFLWLVSGIFLIQKFNFLYKAFMIKLWMEVLIENFLSMPSKCVKKIFPFFATFFYEDNFVYLTAKKSFLRDILLLRPFWISNIN